MTVKLQNSQQLDEIIKNIKKSSIRKDGILNIQLNNSSNSDIQKYRKLVKEEAIKAAKAKADYLLAAMGENRGAVITISENADPKSKTTTHQGFYGGYYGWPYYGGGNGYTTSNGGLNNVVSNSSVSMPSGGGGGHGGSSKPDDLGMKPIRLFYEIEAVFEIK